MAGSGTLNGINDTHGARGGGPHHRRGRLPCAGLAVALAAGTALAQPSMHAPVITLDWPGGTVGTYVEALRNASREAVVNVVLDAEVSSWDVGPMRLTGVTALQALQAGAAAARFEGGGRVAVEDQSTRGGDPGAGFAVLSIVRPGRAERPTDLGVLPLRSLVETLPSEEGSAGATVEAVLSAIEAGLNLADADGRPAQLQFHPASYLLMVQGDGSELEAASRIVSLLGRDAAERRERLRQEEAAVLEKRVRSIAEATSGDAATAVVELSAERRRMALMQEQAQLELAAREAEAAQLKQLHERGMTSDSELRETELALSRARMEAEVVASEIQRVEDRLVLAQSRAGGGSDEALEATAAGLRERIEMARLSEAAARARLEEASARQGVDMSPADLERLRADLLRMENERVELEARLAMVSSRRSQSEVERQRTETQAKAAAEEADAARRAAVESQVRLEVLQKVIEDERRARQQAEDQVQQLVAEVTQLRMRVEILQAELGKRNGNP